MTKKQMIRDHLLTGKTLTRYEAILLYHTTELPYHIFSLRKEGYNIVTLECEDVKGTRYAKYRMLPKAEFN